MGERETENFFSDSDMKKTKDIPLEDREQMWYWINSVLVCGIWYYRDRMGTPRGPCSLPVLREAWTKGIIDDKTLVWCRGLIDWIPIRNVTFLVSLIRTPEVQIMTSIQKNLLFKPKFH